MKLSEQFKKDIILARTRRFAKASKKRRVIKKWTNQMNTKEFRKLCAQLDANAEKIRTAFVRLNIDPGY